MSYFLWSMVLLMVAGLPLWSVVSGRFARRRHYANLRRQAKADLARIRGSR